MGRAIHEIRLAVRALLRAPLVAGLAVGALALGIGGAVTVFSAVNAAFLRALPYPDADRLVAIWQRSLRSSEIAIAYPTVLDWGEGLPEAEHVGGFMGPGDLNVAADRGAGTARVVTATRVTAPFFDTLGVRPILGRAFALDETRPGARRVAVISHDLWQQLFNGAPDIVGRALSIEGAIVPVIGVMPTGVTFPENTSVWTSADVESAGLVSRTAHNFRVLARVRSGVTPSALEAALDRLQNRLEREYPEAKEGLGVRVVPLRAQLLGASADVLRLLFGSVALVLLIACANVANLLLARASGRATESALRRALGADRAALALPVFVEAIVLAIAGTASGIGLALWGQSLLAAVLPPTVVAPEDLRIDGTVLAFAAATAAATAVICSSVPAITATRVDLRGVLTAGSRTLAGGHLRAMHVFIGVQVALSCMLLASAVLFARGLAHLENISPGFQAARVAYAAFAIGQAPGSAYESTDARVAFYRGLLERVNGVPEVAASGLTSSLPFAPSPNGGIEVDGGDPEQKLSAHFRLVGGRYFDALGIPLRAGRLLSEEDSASRPFVALVNEAAARAFWKDRSPLGARIRMPGMDGEPAWYTIVGVVGDIRHRGLTRDPVPEAYFPYAQRPQRTWAMQLVARLESRTPQAERGLDDALRRGDPRIPVTVAPLDTLVDRQVAPTRLRTALAASFGITAVVLSMVGIFGVMSYFVTRRTREVGLRMALGAARGHVQRLIVTRALAPVGVGLVAGLAATVASGRIAESLLPGVSPRDLVALAVAVVVIAGSAAAASWWPAWRASRVDPMVALRDE